MTRFPKARGKSNPAPGFRGIGEGALWNVGSEGTVWSSTISSINAIYLNFYVTWLHPSRAYHRASGFQLRCLSE
ncbi:hypothetical protein [uncultured Rikenella sp.]|uniref:hypothetical protein n=1 Tax=uncultured Rikenella sp. TaxID=368003 RepID=UPI00260979C0|nr:hypothetical protein [uncultured Rikenella sp.]